MIGIEDKYNLCTDSWSTTKPRLDAMLSYVFQPSLDASSTSEKFTEMSRALITGLWCFNPFLSFDAHIFFMKMVAGCKSYDYYETNSAGNRLETKANIETMGWYDRTILYLLALAHTCWLNITILRWYFNSQIHLSLVIIHYFPFLAFKFGLRNCYVRILKGDKS